MSSVQQLVRTSAVATFWLRPDTGHQTLDTLPERPRMISERASRGQHEPARNSASRLYFSRVPGPPGGVYTGNGNCATLDAVPSDTLLTPVFFTSSMRMTECRGR